MGGIGQIEGSVSTFKERGSLSSFSLFFSSTSLWEGLRFDSFKTRPLFTCRVGTYSFGYRAFSDEEVREQTRPNPPKPESGHDHVYPTTDVTASQSYQGPSDPGILDSRLRRDSSDVGLRSSPEDLSYPTVPLITHVSLLSPQ